MSLYFFFLVSPIFLFKNLYKKIFILIIIFLITILFERMPGTLYLEIYLGSLFFFLFIFTPKSNQNKKKQYYSFIILISFFRNYKTPWLGTCLNIITYFYYQVVTDR